MNLIERLKRKMDAAGVWEKTIFLQRNEYLKVKGSINTNLYYVINGSLKIFFEDDYEEQILRLGYRDNFIGALDSFISEAPSDIYIQAIKKCELKVISKKAYLAFIQSDAEHMDLWMQLIVGLVYQQIEREKDILTYSPMKRYQRVLKRSPQLFQEIPNKYIASYLRMSPETLSRLKKRRE